MAAVPCMPTRNTTGQTAHLLQLLQSTAACLPCLVQLMHEAALLAGQLLMLALQLRQPGLHALGPVICLLPQLLQLRGLLPQLSDTAADGVQLALEGLDFRLTVLCKLVGCLQHQDIWKKCLASFAWPMRVPAASSKKQTAGCACVYI